MIVYALEYFFDFLNCVKIIESQDLGNKISVADLAESVAPATATPHG